MIYLDAIILTCFRLLNGDRSRSSIFHLLTGKKSSQTIQDAHLYGIANLFQTFPKMSRKLFDSRCDYLINRQLITELEEQRYIPTQDGVVKLEQFFHKHPFPRYLQGWAYHDHAMVFWRRLTLYVQSASNIHHHEKSFYPVQRDPEIQRWVKNNLLSWGANKELHIAQLHDELRTLCKDSAFPDDPTLMIQQLSGYKMIGSTIDQLSEQLGADPTEIYYRFLNIIHFSLKRILESQLDFPILYTVQQVEEKNVILTASTLKTRPYINKNYSVEDIAAARNLKESTIEDHIIEMALMIPSFSIKPYVSVELQEKIWSETLKLNHKRLREIKQCIQEATYFQIRLVLVSRGREEEGKWREYSMKNLDTPPSEKVKKK